MDMKDVPRDFSPSRILVIQLRQIGDVLLATPSLRALRRRFPKARIFFLSEPGPAKVLSENPDLDEIIIRDPKAGGIEPLRTILDVRSRRFDLVVDFLANPRTAIISLFSGARVRISYAGNRRSGFYTHPVEPQGVFSALQKLSLLRVLGIDGGPVDLVMPVADYAKKRIDTWFEGNGLGQRTGPLVCQEPFQKWPVLEYPAAHQRELARMMMDRWGATVVVCWGPGREDDARRFVEGAGLLLAPPTDLHELAALYGKADLWVGADSGARHIAASQKVPTFAVFGPTDDAWTPPGPRHLSVGMDKLECRPCNKRRCPEGHHRCLQQFPPEEVFERLDQFWKEVSG